MIMYIIITVFLVGLMSGRTPEYLGIKITGRDVKLVMIAFLIHPIIILVPTVLAYATGAASAIGVSSNSVGFTQILWEFTTSAANNGSDFLGASANTPFFNISTGIVMFLGRYLPILLLLALAGSMIGRKRSSETGLKTDSPIFSIVLIASITHRGRVNILPLSCVGTDSIILQRTGERIWLKLPKKHSLRAVVPERKASVLTGKVLLDSFARLNPRSLIANPVMFLVEVTFFIVLAMAIYPQGFYPVASLSQRPFYVTVAVILLVTVWFSTLSDALAEKQAKNTASSLRKLETEVPAKKIVTEGWSRKTVSVSSKALAKRRLNSAREE